MGIFDSVFSAFGGNPAQPEQPQPPGNIPPNSGTVDPDNSTVPAGTVNNRNSNLKLVLSMHSLISGNL